MPHNVLDSNSQSQSPTEGQPPHNFSLPTRKQSQHSEFAKAALMSKIQQAGITSKQDLRLAAETLPTNISQEVLPPSAVAQNTGLDGTVVQDEKSALKPRPRFAQDLFGHGVGQALTDTPLPSVPNSPRM
jgi:hypothetical protein